MIRKLDNGSTVITLGEGTVYSGLVTVEGYDRPFGISFSNQKGENIDPNGTVIFEVQTNEAVASYLMSLVRLLETWDKNKDSDFSKHVENLKRDLEKFMPMEKTQKEQTKTFKVEHRCVHGHKFYPLMKINENGKREYADWNNNLCTVDHCDSVGWIVEGIKSEGVDK